MRACPSCTHQREALTFVPPGQGISAFLNLTHLFVLLQARVLQQYVEERSVTPLALNYDFALITLSNAAPKGTTYLDIAAGDGTVRYDLTTAGYPADKSGQDMWTVRLLSFPSVSIDRKTDGRRVSWQEQSCRWSGHNQVELPQPVS